MIEYPKEKHFTYNVMQKVPRSTVGIPPYVSQQKIKENFETKTREKLLGYL